MYWMKITSIVWERNQVRRYSDLLIRNGMRFGEVQRLIRWEMKH